MALLEVARSLDRDLLIGVGGDSTERGLDHHMFEPLIAEAKKLGLKTCFHCGEDGPAENIAIMVEAGIDRIDHGTRLLDLPDLTKRVVDEQIPLTSCPGSNVEIGIVDSLEEHPFVDQRAAAPLATLIGDAPTLFRCVVSDESVRVATTCDPDMGEMVANRDNAIEASWLAEVDGAALRAEFAAS